ncbi:MAG: hypothetical protein IJX74_01520 [Clostridia bacterium]|nr:hypothetical protein [Clostridia bacterium]
MITEAHPVKDYPLKRTLTLPSEVHSQHHQYRDLTVRDSLKKAQCGYYSPS